MSLNKKINSLYLVALTVILAIVLFFTIVLFESEVKELPLQIRITSDGTTAAIKP